MIHEPSTHHEARLLSLLTQLLLSAKAFNAHDATLKSLMQMYNLVPQGIQSFVLST